MERPFEILDDELVAMDTGCSLHPVCLSCPYPECAEDVGKQAAIRAYERVYGKPSPVRLARTQRLQGPEVLEMERVIESMAGASLAAIAARLGKKPSGYLDRVVRRVRDRRLATASTPGERVRALAIRKQGAYAIAKEARLPLRRVCEILATPDATAIIAILDAHDRGESSRAIARFAGVSRVTVEKRIRQQERSLEFHAETVQKEAA